MEAEQSEVFTSKHALAKQSIASQGRKGSKGSDGCWFAAGTKVMQVTPAEHDRCKDPCKWHMGRTAACQVHLSENRWKRETRRKFPVCDHVAHQAQTVAFVARRLRFDTRPMTSKL